MTRGLKDIMSTLGMINEAELFCSDMQYKVDDKKITEKIIGDNSMKSEDIKIKCENLLLHIRSTYRSKFDEIYKRV